MNKKLRNSITMVTFLACILQLRFYRQSHCSYWALKVEKVKKDNDIQTYKEIVAFLEGKRLDEIQKQQEIGKRPYQNVLKGIVAGIVTIVVCFLIGLLFHLLGN